MTDTAASGPLRGVRVVELAGQGPGPFCCMLLADFGADVVRVDRVDDARGEHRHPKDVDIINRGRPSIAVDMKQAAGRDLVLALVERADVLVEGFRPGVAERLGVGPDDCRARNPRLVYARITGFGQDGPFAMAAGHDVDYLALSGALGALGPADHPPVAPLNLVSDFGGGGALTAFAIVAALHERSTSGEGQVVDHSLTEGAALLLTPNLGPMQEGWWSPRRGTNLLDGGAPFYNVYLTADGGHVAFGAIEPKFYAAMLDGLGLAGEALPDQGDEEQWPAMRARVAAIVATRTRDEWEAVFAGRDACFAPVLAPLEAPDHPQHRARGAFTEVGGFVQAAPAPKLSRTPGAVRAPGTHPGADTTAVLAELGLDDASIERLLADGVVAQS